MLKHNYTSEMLNLEGVNITKAENVGEELHISLELPAQEQKCPRCGEKTTRIHDYRQQKIKDVPLGRTTYLHLRKRRYVCPCCGKRFYEQNHFLARYQRTTRRLFSAVLEAFREVRSCKAVAQNYNISSSTAFRYFDHISYRCKELPRIVSIDEFKGNAGGEKYNCIVTNPEEKKVLDVLPNRFEGDLVTYFKRFKNREKVEFFVTDMNPHFRSVAQRCFPNAEIIADRYHVVRQAVWAMEKVRKAEQKRLSSEFRIYFKRSKYLLNKSIKNLTEDEKSRLALMIEISPKLAQAYKLKLYFSLVMHSEPEKAKKLLSDWIILAEHYDIPEFQACIKAYRNWSKEILNAIRYPWSNGFTEGCNNKTKVIKRVSFGVSNFSRFRNRILHCSV